MVGRTHWISGCHLRPLQRSSPFHGYLESHFFFEIRPQQKWTFLDDQMYDHEMESVPGLVSEMASALPWA